MSELKIISKGDAFLQIGDEYISVSSQEEAAQALAKLGQLSFDYFLELSNRITVIGLENPISTGPLDTAIYGVFEQNPHLLQAFQDQAVNGRDGVKNQIIYDLSTILMMYLSKNEGEYDFSHSTRGGSLYDSGGRPPVRKQDGWVGYDERRISYGSRHRRRQ